MAERSDMSAQGRLSAYERWEIPSLDEPQAQRSAVVQERMRLPTAEELEDLRRQAHEAGYASGREQGLQQGRQEGLQQGQAEVAAQAARLAALIHAYTHPIEQQGEALAHELVQMSKDLAQAVIEQEVRTSSAALQAIIMRALQQIDARAQALTLQLNPEDARLLREQLQAQALWQEQWRITENPLLTQGGCIIETPTHYLDARMDERREQVFASLDSAHGSA